MELVDVRFIGMAPDGRWPLEHQQQQQQKERKIFFGKHLLNFPDTSAAIRDVKKTTATDVGGTIIKLKRTISRFSGLEHLPKVQLLVT